MFGLTLNIRPYKFGYVKGLFLNDQRFSLSQVSHPLGVGREAPGAVGVSPWKAATHSSGDRNNAPATVNMGTRTGRGDMPFGRPLPWGCPVTDVRASLPFDAMIPLFAAFQGETPTARFLFPGKRSSIPNGRIPLNSWTGPSHKGCETWVIMKWPWSQRPV